MPRTFDDRDEYHRILTDVQDACATENLSFPQQMSMLCIAWLRQRGDYEAPEIEPEGPGGLIMQGRFANENPNSPPKSPPPVSRGVVKGSGPPPKPQRQRRTVKGPSVEEILALKEGEWLAVNLDQLGLKKTSLAQRVTTANREVDATKRIHFESYIAVGGSMVIECVAGPPRKRKAQA